MPEVIIIQPNQTFEPRKQRAAGYARVSSDSDDQKNSFAAQMDYYTELLGNNPEYDFIDVYADEGITGTSMEKREDFLRMMSDCRKGKIDRIFTKKVSRFARNTADSLECVRELRTLGVTVYFIEDNIDTANMTDEMLLAIVSTMAQNESETISSNVRWSYKHRMQSGEFITCKAPFGYRLEDKRLIINDEEAEHIRYIFNSYINGVSKTVIAKDMMANGITTRDGNAKWDERAISRILKNERYMGDSLLQKKCSTETFPYKKIRNHGQKDQYYIKNSHEPIISREVFEQAQSLINRRRPPASQKAEYPLSKKIQCAECGTTYKRRPVNGITRWVCYRHDTDRKACPAKPIPESEILAAFVRMVNKLKLNKEYILTPLLAELKDLQNRVNAGNVRITKINTQIAELANQNYVLKDAMSKGYLDSDIFMRQNNEINAQIADLRKEKRRIMNADNDDDTLRQTQIITNIIDGTDTITEFDKTLFDRLVGKIIAVQGDEIQFELINGLRLTEKILSIKR